MGLGAGVDLSTECFVAQSLGCVNDLRRICYLGFVFEFDYD